MADVLDIWSVEAGARVQDLPSTVQVGKMPTPIIVRAEQLCEALDAAGEHRPDRQFLIAAIIATTEPDIEDLAARLRRYRLILVHEVVGAAETEGDLDLPRSARPT